MSASIQEDHVDIKSFEVRSPILQVSGYGRLTFDMYLDMFIRAPNLFPAAESYLIIPVIYKIITNGLVSFRVWGFLRDLHSEAVFVIESKSPRPQLGPILPRRRKRSTRL